MNTTVVLCVLLFCQCRRNFINIISCILCFDEHPICELASVELDRLQQDCFGILYASYRLGCSYVK
jgi:hypothetical protein